MSKRALQQTRQYRNNIKTHGANLVISDWRIEISFPKFKQLLIFYCILTTAQPNLIINENFSVIFPGLCSLPSNEQSVFNSTKQAKRTRSTNKILFLLIGLALVVSSCKKIEQFPSTKSVKGLSPAIKSPIETIPYKDFLQAVDINKTGELRKALSITPNNNVKSVNTENETFAFDLDVSNVKKLVIGDTISYVLSLKPRTPGAVHFENITIQTSNGKVAAFLTTYLPTKKWIDDWRTVKHLAFDGEVFVNRIELSDNPVKVEDVKIQSITSTAKKKMLLL